MKRTLLLSFTASCGVFLAAGQQKFSFDISHGANLCKLVPTMQSDKSVVTYGFGQPDLYLGAAVNLHMDEHSSASFGYQLSENNAGVRLKRSVTGEGNYEMTSDYITLHNITVGYHYKSFFLFHRASIEGFAKLGIAYGSFDGASSAGGSGGFGSSGSTTSYLQVSEQRTKDFWMPNVGAGFQLAPYIKDNWLGDRLSFSVAGTCGLRDPYKYYTVLSYYTSSQNGTSQGEVKYRGIPVQLQLGANFRI